MAIETPILETRSEEQLAAEAIGKVSGGLTPDIVRSQIKTREELLKLILSGNLTEQPVCPELTNANPSSPHTVILEAIAWQLAQQRFLINYIPVQNVVAFANLFQIEQRAATKAQATLRFTKDAGAPAGQTITIPAGTVVSDGEQKYLFATTAPAVIAANASYVEVSAERDITGHTLLSPAVLTEQIDPIAYISAVTNPSAVDSGSARETLDSALERMRQYQRRSERMVSAKDIEEAIVSEALGGSGVVRVFPFVEDGDFTESPKPGFTTIIVMTREGFPVDAAAKRRISRLLDEQTVGNQYTYIIDPVFVNFNVSAKVKLSSTVPQNTVLAEIEKNLRAFYSAERQSFGRQIFRSEIIEIIERTPGVDHIVAQASGAILASPATDLKTNVWELAKLVTVTLEAV